MLLQSKFDELIFIDQNTQNKLLKSYSYFMNNLFNSKLFSNQNNNSLSNINLNPTVVVDTTINFKRYKLFLYLNLFDFYRRNSKIEEANKILKIILDFYQNGLIESDILFFQGIFFLKIFFFKGIFLNFIFLKGIIYLKKKKGLLFEDTLRIDDSISTYENSLLIDPNNSKVYIRLAIIYYEKDKEKYSSLSRSYLQNSIRIDPNNYESWYYLAKILKDVNEFVESSNCYLTSLKLLKTNPILPFNILSQFKFEYQ
jgi:tetratricopeptide (TPR) repeat protein